MECQTLRLYDAFEGDAQPRRLLRPAVPEARLFIFILLVWKILYPCLIHHSIVAVFLHSDKNKPCVHTPLCHE